MWLPKKLKDNLKILHDVEEETGCHILLAQKAFSMYSLYPMIGEYISGTTASGLYEARIGYEEMGKENHVFAPAYKSKDISRIFSSPSSSRMWEIYSENTGFGDKIRIWFADKCFL